MNEDMVKGKWTEMKGAIRNAWGKLTDDELERTKGNVTEISGLIQQKYGEAKDDVGRKLEQITSKFKGSMKSSQDIPDPSSRH